MARRGVKWGRGWVWREWGETASARGWVLAVKGEVGRLVRLARLGMRSGREGKWVGRMIMMEELGWRS